MGISVVPPKEAGQGFGPEVPTVPQTLPDATALEGHPIVAVRARIEGAIWTTPPKIVAPKVGDKLVVDQAENTLRALLSGGGFATGALDVTPAAGGGVEVVFRLVPARFVRRVVLRGNVLGEDEIRRIAGFADARDVTEASLDAATQRIRAYYRRRGYPSVRVEVSTIETDAPLTVIVDVHLEAGDPDAIAGRTFVGLPVSDEEAVAAAHAYPVKVGDRVDEEELDLADRAMGNALRSASFSTALVTHAVTPGERGVEVTITVVAGSKIVPVFEGNVVFDREQLLKVIDIPGEADRSPAHFAVKLESAYVRRGYLDARAVPELLGQVGDERRTLRFRITEGAIVRVKARVYPCLFGALDAARLDEEIDSYLDEELEGGGFGDVDPKGTDRGFSSGGDVTTGARPFPDVPPPPEVFAADTYDRAVEHLRDLFRSEGYIFAEVGAPTLVRGSCAKGSQPGECKVLEPPPLPQICRTDLDQLPKESAPIPKSYSCVADPLKGIECAPFVTVVIPVNPGPRSILWDVAFEGTKAMAPALLGGSGVAGRELRLGEPLSLRDVENARRRILEKYRDEAYAFASVRATLEYSSDKSRARVRFIVAEGEQVVIDNIYVEGNKHTLESLVRARLRIEEKGLYRQGLVGDSQERLARLNVFSSVSIGLVNPTIPSKHKNVIVTLVERPTSYLELRGGYSTGEGVRGYIEYGYTNLFGYAVGLTGRVKLSYQPFLGCFASGPATESRSTNQFSMLSATTLTGETAYNCGQSPLYDADVVRRWNNQLSGLERYPRRISFSIALPHTPLFGAPVRTTIDLVESLDLFRDFKLERRSPVLTFTYVPVRWFTSIFAGDLERNDFLLFDKAKIDDFLATGSNLARFGTLLRVPDGVTSVAATRATFTFDFRDNRLGATKNGFFSITNEYVVSIAEAQKRQQFLHLTSAAGGYVRLPFLPKQPVLAMELAGGGNFNVLNCASNPDCDIYPDRLFYLGGVDSNRGFLFGQMLPQDSIDQLIAQNPDTTGGQDLSRFASRGGTVYINPRIELRVPAWKWGGFVIFLDAANSWRDKTKFLRDASGRFAPWRLRYAVGPGLSIDTPVGPIALDFGFNLTRYDAFNEPLLAFHFSIGRF
ncbi:MAG: hypothetical protein NVS3B10_07050 [Polyangiales bacterium]